MRDRVLGLVGAAITSFIGTFHSLGARILKAEARLAKRTPSFTIFDNDDSLSLLKKIMKEKNLSRDRYNPLAIAGQISSVKNELLDPKEYLDPIGLKLYENYEAALEKNNAFDFDDLIEKVVLLLQKNPAVLEKYQNKFRYILVDEYQDVNTSQYQMVRLLAECHKNINVVGDDAQSIYAFRGSDFRNFLNFEKDWPKAKIVLLEQNYRSAGNIITAASALIKNNKYQKPKTLWTENPAGELVKILACEDAEQEAEWITNQIARSETISTTAILYRTNAQSRSIEQELIASGIPYKIFGGLKFYERKEIKDIVAALRLATNPKDEISRERILKNFHKAVAQHLLEELPRLSKDLGILQLINWFLNNADYFEYLDKNYKNAREREENIKELIVFASEFTELPEFLERVSLMQSADIPTKNTAIRRSGHSPVNLMTVHLAKGLEFEKIFVIGCNEGLLPHQMSYGARDELEEERRLMYVAMTRAKKELFLSFYNLPSRFLGEIPPELTEPINIGGRRRKLRDEEKFYVEDY